MNKKYWLDFGDIDGEVHFLKSSKTPKYWGQLHGPFKTLREARQLAVKLCASQIDGWKVSKYNAKRAKVEVIDE